MSSVKNQAVAKDMVGPRTRQSAPGADCHLPPRMPMTREQLINLLHLPLPELNPPGLAPEQLSGLRTLPLFCEHLKLIYGLPALEPLAERPASETVEALLLAARILSSVGGVATRTRT